MNRLFCFLSLLLGTVLAPTARAQQAIGPFDFSPNAVKVTLEAELGSTFSGPVGTRLMDERGLGVEVVLGTAADSSGPCPGQVDLRAGDFPGASQDPIVLTFRDPATGQPATTTAFGTYVGSLGAEVSLHALDASGQVVATVRSSPTSPYRRSVFPVGDFLGIRYPGGIHSVVLTNGASEDVFVMGDFYVTGTYPACTFGKDFLFEPIQLVSP